LINIIPAFEPGWRQHEEALSRHVNISEQLRHIGNLEVLRKALSAVKHRKRKKAASWLSRYVWDDSDPFCLRVYFNILSRVFAGNQSKASACRRVTSRLKSGTSPASPHRVETERLKDHWDWLNQHDVSGRELVRSYSAKHAAFVEAALGGEGEEDRALVDKSRFLVCQPTFGLGNRVNAMMMCMTVALLTGRVLFLHWNCMSCHDELAYPIGLGDFILMGFVDWNPDLLLLLFDDQEIWRMSKVVVEPGVSDGGEAGRQEESLMEVFATMNIDHIWHQRILVLNLYRFYPSIFDNPHYRSFFKPEIAGGRRSLRSFAPPPPPAWYARMGLRAFGGPPAWALLALEETRRIVSLFDVSGQIVGLQMRRHLPTSYEGVKRDRKSVRHFGSCALSAAGDRVNAWILVTDSFEGRIMFLGELVERLGCLVWIDGSDRFLRDVGASRWMCSNQTTAPPLVHEFVQTTSPVGGTVSKLARGDLIVFFDGEVARASAAGAALAVLEMWLLSLLPDLVVITEQSSFIHPISAFSPKPTVGFSQTSVAPVCRRLKTSEPDCSVKAGRYACS